MSGDTPPLARLRLPLDAHDSDLLLVGEPFEQGSSYVQIELPRSETESWSWLDWDDAYDRLTRQWRARFYRERRRTP